MPTVRDGDPLAWVRMAGRYRPRPVQGEVGSTAVGDAYLRDAPVRYIIVYVVLTLHSQYHADLVQEKDYNTNKIVPQYNQRHLTRPPFTTLVTLKIVVGALQP